MNCRLLDGGVNGAGLPLEVADVATCPGGPASSASLRLRLPLSSIEADFQSSLDAIDLVSVDFGTRSTDALVELVDDRRVRRSNWVRDEEWSGVEVALQPEQ